MAATSILSIVGFQPGAILVALDTWAHEFGFPREVVLFATPAVRKREIPSRIVEAYRHWKSSVFTIVDVARDLSDSPIAPCINTAVADTIHRLPRGQVAWLVDPGARFLVVSASRQLPPDTAYVTCDVDQLRVFRPGAGHPLRPRTLRDVGLDRLLRCYGLLVRDKCAIDVKLAAVVSDLPSRMRTNVGLGLQVAATRSQFGVVPIFDAVRERAGTLHVLCSVPADEGQNRLRQIMSAASGLNGLQPRFTICSGSRFMRAHATEAGFAAVRPSDAESWFRAETPSPGHEQAESRDHPVAVPPRIRGAGGDGPSLALWMGKDPSATLTALFTHRPAGGVLLYDAATPAITENVRRLAAKASAIPCGELTTVPSNMRGTIASAAFMRGLPKGRVLFNATPGTKAQVAQVAHLVPEIWTLVQHEKVARPLGPGGDGPSLALQAAPVVVQAELCGGALDAAGQDARLMPAGQLEFLRALARALSTRCGAETGFVPLKSGQGVHVSGRQIVVREDSHRHVGYLPVETGGWFEVVVAGCCVLAGMDEVRLGVRWAWDMEQAARMAEVFDGAVTHKREADVVIRWGSQYFVIECKAGSKGTVASQSRAIAAIARAMGRFAIPVLARPCLTSTQAGPSYGVTPVSLATLGDSAMLRGFFEETARTRSSITES